MKRLLSTLLIAFAGGGISLLLYTGFIDTSNDNRFYSERTHSVPITQVSTASVPVGTMDFTGAASKSLPAVVHVKTEYVPQTYYNPWSEFFGGRKYYQAEPAKAAGSGVIISPDGYIVTNNHVISEAQKIEVTLNNMNTYEATLVGSDPSTDLALLKIDDTDLPYLSFGNSDDILVGEWVLAVGNPFNLTSTVTAGIVSAKARSLNLLQYDPNADQFPIESFIQTDAAVNPGNSGGALVNASGDLIGINTAIASKTGSYTGYSFAIPSSIVQKITNDLFEYGVVQRAFIGVSIANISDEIMDAENLNRRTGAFVRGLTEGGAAADAGIEPGDVIIKVNDVPVNNVTQLQEQIGRFRPGDNVVVQVLRDNKEKTFNVTLRNQHGNTEIRRKPANTTTAAFGAAFEKADETILQKLKLKNGVAVKDITRGLVSNAGIKDGFIITKIDKKPVNDPDQVKDLLQNNQGGVLIEGMYPNGAIAYYGFGM